MAILETIADVGSAITNVVGLIFGAFVDVHDSLNEFYNMLKDFNQTVVAITKDPSTGTGLPVVESIGVFRYLVGDPAFFVIYMVILFGCLFTIYKLVCLIVEAFHALKEQASAGSYSASHLTGLLGKIFK